jgi:hypothetical protein
VQTTFRGALDLLRQSFCAKSFYCLFCSFGFLPRFLALEFSLSMLGELCFARPQLILSSLVKQIPPQCSLLCVIFRVTDYCVAFYAAALLIGVAQYKSPV